MHLPSNCQWEAVCKEYIVRDLEVGNLIFAECTQLLGCSALWLFLQAHICTDLLKKDKTAEDYLSLNNLVYAKRLNSWPVLRVVCRALQSPEHRRHLDACGGTTRFQPGRRSRRLEESCPLSDQLSRRDPLAAFAPSLPICTNPLTWLPPEFSFQIKII